MKQLRLYVEDEKLTKIEQILSDNEVVYEVETPSDGIPEWHKKILLERLNNPDPGPSISGEEMLAELARMRNEHV